MSKMIQIRNVPDDIHRKMKARAALAGMTLSDYLLAEARRIIEKPPPPGDGVPLETEGTGGTCRNTR